MSTIINYRTPLEIFELAKSLFGDFDLDVASSSYDTLIPKYLEFNTEDDNGLTNAWKASSVWCNPPYDNTEAWIKKAIHECFVAKNTNQVVMLLATNTGVSYWEDIIKYAFSIHFIIGRISFVNPSTCTRDKGNRHNSCFVLFNNIKPKESLTYIYSIQNPQKGKINEFERTYKDQRIPREIETKSIGIKR